MWKEKIRLCTCVNLERSKNSQTLEQKTGQQISLVKEFEAKVDHRKVAHSWDLHKEAKTRFLDNSAYLLC